MNLLPVVSELTTIRAAFAGLVLMGRILLLLATLRRWLVTVGDERTPPRPSGSATVRTVSRLVSAAQVGGAVVAIIEWFYAVGIVQMW